MGYTKLRYTCLSFKNIFGLVTVPYSWIISTAKNFILSAWNINNTCKLNIFLSKIFIVKPIRAVFDIYQVPLECISTLISRNQSHIIFKPINGSYLWRMRLQSIMGGSFAALIKIVNLHRLSSDGSCKEMTSITELYFSACFNLNIFKRM